MRVQAVLVAALSLLCLAPAAAHAQIGGGAGGGGGGGEDTSSQDDAKKRRLDREMQTQALPLPPVKAEGPCPFVKILYDAARTIEFKDNKQASGNVQWSGEMQGLVSDCAYTGDKPIKVQINLTFLFGKGPQGQGNKKAFTYWVAVTERDKTVLDKQYFTVDANFPAGSDRVIVVDPISDIEIPRAKSTVSGANFEILLGFDVSPEMAAFNREGARFLVNAGSDAATASSAGTRTAR